MPEILYRKWRPRTFAELAGQEHVATTLTNALATGRVSHAYLLTGPRGTGKTSTGRLIGKALNCTDRRDGEPCNACESCLSYLAGRAMDLVELDAASNRGIDEIRSLRDKVAFAPGAGDFKVYLIDEVHMLTEAAFNALLKTLEEPPAHVVFVLATTDPQKVPATIASRCQRFDFRRVSLAAARARLEEICAAEGFACEPAALDLIIRSATGSMRDAINVFDQLVTSYGRDLSIEHVRSGLGLIEDGRAATLARLALAGDLGGGLAVIASVRDDGLDLRQFQKELVKDLRGLLLVKSGLEPEGGVTAEQKADMAAAVSAVLIDHLLTALRAFGEADLRADPNSTIPLDVALADCILGRMAAPAAAATAATPTPRTAPERVRPAEGPSAGSGHSVRTRPQATQPAAGPPPRNRIEAWAADAADSAPANGGAPAADLDQVRELMPRIYAAAREKEFHVGALLNGPCDIMGVNESEVTFVFRHPNHVQKIMEPQNHKVLVEAVRQVIGRPLTVRCVHDAEATSWKQREAAARSPLVRAAQEMGARVLPSENGEER